jgi:hypothetical protein
MPHECCPSIEKLMKPDLFTNCGTQCVRDPCCMGECMGKSLNFLKNGQYDKETAKSSMNTAFSGNPEWLPVSSSKFLKLPSIFHSNLQQVVTKAVNECETEGKLR